MNIPDEAFGEGLSDFEFRLLAVLCRLTGDSGQVHESIDNLGMLAGGASRSTVKRALKSLKAQGLVQKWRSKRANGYWGPNIYIVGGAAMTPPGGSLVDPRFEPAGGSTGEPSSLGQVVGQVASHDYKVSELNSIGKYFVLPGMRSAHTEKEGPKMSFNRNWDDGEDIAGFGLLESDTPPPVAVSKADPKTRWKRPQEEWTPADVAAEFSYLVSQKFPWAPGATNQAQLRGALSKYRKDHGTSAVIELELLRMFLADDRNWKDMGDRTDQVYRVYLKMFQTSLIKAYDNLGIPRPKAAGTPVVQSVGKIVSSDGLREYDNTIQGRAFMKAYEERIKSDV